MFAFFSISVTKLSLAKIGGITGIFSRYKKFEKLTNAFLLVIMDYLVIFQGFFNLNFR